jgi:hypothetical protein
VALVRIVSSVERSVTNALASFLQFAMAVLTRLLGRGRHREWRKRNEADARRRAGGST